MDPHLMILIVGLSYTVVYGLMAILRREGVTTQFILESVVLTGLVAVGGYFTDSPANPILFLVFLYILTSRSRLLVDLANMLSNRGRQRDAINILQVALRMFPDKPTRLIVLVNMGIVQLRRENPESTRMLLETVLEEAQEGGLGLRHKAACYYNLGLAFQKLGKEGQAVRYFKQAVDVFPGSPYGKAAAKAIDERRKGKKEETED
ncbi:MAG: tetratricopeptide repeat protein [Anaerolineaceae bacterium]|nr:MAG: tetratricopeptide repeat protein [Anaerolineaceae bacterium]